MSKKLTPWFPASITPERVGVYEIYNETLGGVCFSYFDGTFWRGGWSSISRADKHSKWEYHYGLPGQSWRGLASDPNEGRDTLLLWPGEHA